MRAAACGHSQPGKPPIRWINPLASPARAQLRNLGLRGDLLDEFEVFRAKPLKLDMFRHPPAAFL